MVCRGAWEGLAPLGASSQGAGGQSQWAEGVGERLCRCRRPTRWSARGVRRAGRLHSAAGLRPRGSAASRLGDGAGGEDVAGRLGGAAISRALGGGRGVSEPSAALQRQQRMRALACDGPLLDAPPRQPQIVLFSRALNSKRAAVLYPCSSPRRSPGRRSEHTPKRVDKHSLERCVGRFALAGRRLRRMLAN